MRAKDPMHCKPYADRFGCEFVPGGQKCWGVKDVDIYMPAATQNDVNLDWAKKIAESGVKYYIEVANMPTTNDALEFLKEQKHMVVAPSKAVNAGGVSVSELEMAQNAERLYWSAEEVDAKLKGIMKNIYHSSAGIRGQRIQLLQGDVRPAAGYGHSPGPESMCRARIGLLEEVSCAAGSPWALRVSFSEAWRQAYAIWE